nr:hypothetical protein [Tanacetum cinerariifolium]
GKIHGRGYDIGHEAEQKQVKIMEGRRDKVKAEYHVLELQLEGTLSKSLCEAYSLQDKVVNMAVGDSMTHWIGMSMLASKGNVLDVRKVDIYFCKLGGLGKQNNLSFIMLVKRRKLQRLEQVHTEGYSPTFIESKDPTTIILLSNTTAGVTVESTGIRVEDMKMLWENSSPGGSSDTSEGSKNSGSFEESGRSDVEYSEDGAFYKVSHLVNFRSQLEPFDIVIHFVELLAHHLPKVLALDFSDVLCGVYVQYDIIF